MGLIAFPGIVLAQNAPTPQQPYITFIIAEHYQNSALHLLKRAQKAGVSYLGTENPVSLDTLIQRASEIKYVALENFVKPEGAYRHTAFYSPSTKTVFINLYSPVDTDLISVLALHEILGALGYNDSDYDISLGLFLYTNASLKAPGKVSSDQSKYITLSEINRAFDRQAFVIPGPDSFLNYGGVNFVGGAGDIRSLRYKHDILVLLWSLDFDETIKRLYSKAFFQMSFEFGSSNSEIQFVKKRQPLRSLGDVLVIVPEDRNLLPAIPTADLLTIASFVNDHLGLIHDAK
ncbi:hypothetical protein AZI86_01035 [Bdellovibrio bacteriovorus]|uniref:Uncharacterized protein n=2 Tax=Bdellovibrio bacteriovorus TaxID=959 RepID=A0A150WMQ1_BDEBC|nr:hypothetical protein AZI86_01035 [Bdellovibrio bacteriovorus]